MGPHTTPFSFSLHFTSLRLRQSCALCAQLVHCGQPCSLSSLAAFSSGERSRNLGQFLSWSDGQSSWPVPLFLSLSKVCTVWQSGQGPLRRAAASKACWYPGSAWTRGCTCPALTTSTCSWPPSPSWRLTKSSVLEAGVAVLELDTVLLLGPSSSECHRSL